MASVLNRVGAGAMAAQRAAAPARLLSLGDGELATLGDEISPVDHSSVASSPTRHETPCNQDDWSVELAVDVLDAVSRSMASAHPAFSRRAELVEHTEQLVAAEAASLEQQQLAYIEHMHATVRTLHAELERYQQQQQQSWRATANSVAGPDSSRLLGDALALSPSCCATKQPARSMVLMRSPLAARIAPRGSRAFAHDISSASPVQSSVKDPAQEWTNVLGRTAELHASRPTSTFLPELESAQRDKNHAAAKFISTREAKLKEILREKAHWESEYQLMREQVVEEKMRQVELFHRLEAQKRESAQRCERLERALREAQHENELLKSQLAEARVKLTHQHNTLTSVMRLAKEEKESLVCTIAETRHKFKEWKDGEASTLKAARDQAVHTLKTEYELKIARHHSEKQKLRDKVKDLEVSLRLLQKDRNLSPQELSIRKATILGSRDTGNTAESELIEAHCRIKELEALLDHAKEYQKRQENIIRMSEATIVKLEQEREVVALEHATLLQPLASLSTAVDVTAPSSPNNTQKLTRRPSKMTQASDTSFSRSAQSRTSAGNASMLASNNNSSSTASFKPSGADAEKELLRRQSVVLTAEVEKYRHMVVQSLDEIRALRDNRRRSFVNAQAGSGTNSANLASAREQYLMNELFKVQKELDAMKAGSHTGNRGPDEAPEEIKERQTSSCSDDSSDSDSESESDGAGEGIAAPQVDEAPPVAAKNESADKTQVAAVTMIQKRSKGFLMRRDFIKKKRAIDKIKAQYRGYLVRKNVELLDLTHRPFVVTDAIQVKMQIVDVHYEVDKLCGNKPVRLVLRVSKDPPVVHILLHELLPESSSPPKAYYFHLFEIVALLPMDDETSILEQSSPNDIAQIIGSLLQVVLVAGETKFAIHRNSRRRQDGANLPPLLPAVTGSFLTPLHAQQTQQTSSINDTDDSEQRVCPASSSQTEAGQGNATSADEENDLDTLIRLSRCPSTHVNEVAPPVAERTIEDPEYGSLDVGGDGTPEFEFTSRLVMRRNSTLPPVHEKP